MNRLEHYNQIITYLRSTQNLFKGLFPHYFMKNYEFFFKNRSNLQLSGNATQLVILFFQKKVSLLQNRAFKIVGTYIVA